MIYTGIDIGRFFLPDKVSGKPEFLPDISIFYQTFKPGINYNTRRVWLQGKIWQNWGLYQSDYYKKTVIKCQDVLRGYV
jgi:hypothetical protein